MSCADNINSMLSHILEESITSQFHPLTLCCFVSHRCKDTRPFVTIGVGEGQEGKVSPDHAVIFTGLMEAKSGEEKKKGIGAEGECQACRRLTS